MIKKLVTAGQKHKAVELYKIKKVSLGLGSKLAGVTLSEFIDLLKEHNVYLNLGLACERNLADFSPQLNFTI